MLFIRNPQECRSLTVVAGEALEVGMLVKLVQGAALGDVPKVMKAVEADYADATVIKGIVNHVVDNDEVMDFIINPQLQSYSKNTEADNTYTIPINTLCTFWYDKPIIGFHKEIVDASYTAGVATAREMDSISFDSDTAKLCAYAGADATRDVLFGFVYRNDSPEVTVVFHTL